MFSSIGINSSACSFLFFFSYGSCSPCCMFCPAMNLGNVSILQNGIFSRSLLVFRTLDLITFPCHPFISMGLSIRTKSTLDRWFATRSVTVTDSDWPIMFKILNFIIILVKFYHIRHKRLIRRKPRGLSTHFLQ